MNHKILLTKWDHYGIRNSMLKSFHSYLTGHKQFASFNGKSSELLKITVGFLKDQSLYLYYFLLYINDLPNISKIFHDWFKLLHEIHDHSTRSNFNANEGLIINNLFVPSAQLIAHSQYN